MVGHFTAQINRIYIFLFSQIGGRGESGIFSRDGIQESEKEVKETGWMCMDVLGVGKDCSELWGWCADQGTSDHLWSTSCAF